MVRIFRSNQPVILAPLLFYSFALAIPRLIAPELASGTGPLYKLALDLVNWMGGAITGAILSALLIYVQAIMLNSVINNSKMFSGSSFVAAFIYITMMNLFDEAATFGPVMLANTFLILSLSRIFSVYKQPEVYKEVFDTGLFIGVAALIYWPAITLMLVFMIGVVVLRPFSLRDWIIGWSGCLVPFILVSGWFIYRELFLEFLTEAFVEQWHPVEIGFEFDVEILVKASIIVLISIWGLVRLQASMLKSSIQMRKNSVILTWFLVVALLSGLMSGTITEAHAALPMVSFAIVLAYNLYEVRNRLAGELIYLLILVSILFFQWGPEIELSI